MEFYRFTGAATGLILSGGMTIFFTTLGNGVINPAVFYMLIPSMVLCGILFDRRFVWKGLMKLSKKFKPSYMGSAAFWTMAWPFCKMLSDTLASAYMVKTVGYFAVPTYLTSWGGNGIVGYFLYQAMIGTGMGLVWFLAYVPVFSGISHLRVLLGVGDPTKELSLREEMGEFRLRNK